YQVYYQKPLFSEGYISDSFEITKYSIKNNEINFSKSHNEPLDLKILTENKIFEINTPQSNLIKRVSPTLWTYERLPELKQNLTFELLNLDGENIFDRVLPGYRETFNLNNELNDRLDQELVKFYQNYKDATFPKGSSCYRLKETQWNQAYIESQLSFRSFLSFSEQKEQIVSAYHYLADDKKYFRLIDTTWMGYSLIVRENLETGEMHSGLGNSENQTANIQYISDTLWNVDRHLAYEKSHIYQVDDPNDLVQNQIADNQKMKIAQLQNGCFAFNTQAIKAIQKLNKVNWKQGDSSAIGQFFGQRTWTFEPNS
ncbi:hypothetical protein DZC41_03425, partial [Acinetobacter haemolyticus]